MQTMWQGQSSVTFRLYDIVVSYQTVSNYTRKQVVSVRKHAPLKVVFVDSRAPNPTSRNARAKNRSVTGTLCIQPSICSLRTLLFGKGHICILVFHCNLLLCTKVMLRTSNVGHQSSPIFEHSAILLLISQVAFQAYLHAHRD